MPNDVQERAQKAYQQFRVDPTHPGLRFKRVSDERPLYSARIGLHHRAVGLMKADLHGSGSARMTDYDRLLKIES